MSELNNSFYYEIDTDAENRIINVFWADARSRAASDEGSSRIWGEIRLEQKWV